MESESAATMKFGERTRRAGSVLGTVALSLVALPQVAFAQAAEATAAATAAAGSYVPMKPVPGIGQPIDGAYGFQQQFSPTGRYAEWMHNAILMPVITAVSLLVLFLIMYVAWRFNKRSNPVASRTSHNTVIEVVWTLLPVLILVGIAIPSITLLARQYKPAPDNALTVKATGNQWYWTYSYPDSGGFEVISNMLPDDEAAKRGEPAKLGVDNRMVLPVGEPIRLQTTGADVIHAFAVPSLWFKLDAVPGRINEKVLFIEKAGVYYGQCSELCGTRHGYMPIAIEALPRDKFDAWVLTQGGTRDHQPKATVVVAPVAGAPAAEAAPASTEAAATDAAATASATPAPAA